MAHISDNALDDLFGMISEIKEELAAAKAERAQLSIGIVRVMAEWREDLERQRLRHEREIADLRSFLQRRIHPLPLELPVWKRRWQRSVRS